MAKKTKVQPAYMKDPETLDLFAMFDPQPVKQEVETTNERLDEDSCVSDDGVDVGNVEAVVNEIVTSLEEQVVDITEVQKPVRQPRVKKKEPKSSRRKGRRKEGGAFKTISELASHLDIPQHVLRFWETKFSGIKPMKRGGGRRYYRPEDVLLIERIYQLLYKEGYTIKGVQRLMRISSKQEFLEGVGTVHVVASSPVSDSMAQDQEKSEEEIVSVSDKSDSKDEAMLALLRGLKDIKRELAS